MFSVVAGADTGLVKILECANAKDSSRSLRVAGVIGQQSGELEVEQMCWGRRNEVLAFVARKSGAIDSLNVASGEQRPPLAHPSKTGRFIGLHYSAQRDVLFSATAEGSLCLWSTPAESASVEALTLQKPLEVLRVSEESNALAYGGKENDLRVWDLEKKRCAWTAKNVPNDFLDMRVPVWIKDLQFMDPSKIVVATGFHQIRIYDTKAQRRPIFNTDHGEHPYTCLALRPDNRSVVFADTTGVVQEMDLRNGRIVGAYRGFAGTVKQLAFHPTQPLLVSCGLDRFLRLHSATTRALVTKAYLKQRLNCFLISPENGPAGESSSAPPIATQQPSQSVEIEETEASPMRRKKSSAQKAKRSRQQAGDRKSVV